MGTIIIHSKRRHRCLAAGVWLLLAALLLSGCSKEPINGPGDTSEQVVLDFSIEGIGEMLPATKATLATNTTVRVIAYRSNSSNPAQANYVADQAYYWNGTKLAPCTVDANGNKTADAAEQVMKLSPDNNYDFYAVSPALPLATDKKTLSTAVPPHGMDYAVSAKTTMTVPFQTTPYALTLNELQRQSAQVRLVINDDYVNPTTLTVNSVKVTGLADAVNGVTVGGDIAPTSSGTQSLSLTGSDFTVSGTTATQETPSTVLPLDKATLSLEYGLTLDGVQKTLTGSVIVTLEKGKSYTITASFSSESDITLSVEEWTQNSGNNPGFENLTCPYVVDGKIIVMQDQFSFADGYSLHGPWTKTPAHAEAIWDANESGLNTCGRKFTVAKSNAKDKTGSYEFMPWYEASGTTDTTDPDSPSNPDGYSACGEYSEASDQSDKGQWRLPTLRELKLIYDKKDELTSVNLSYNTYWAATEFDGYTAFAWHVDFDNGSPSYLYKTISHWVRCVRDL